MPLSDVDLLRCHGVLDDAGVLAHADGHSLPLLERIELLVAERDALQHPTTRRPMDQQDIDNRFQYHPPKDEGTKELHQQVRQTLHSVASSFNSALPEGREKSLAITHLEEAMFWANAAIARKGGAA